jgi:hypothetical protein
VRLPSMGSDHCDLHGQKRYICFSDIIVPLKAGFNTMSDMKIIEKVN